MAPSLANRFTKAHGVKYPIAQAGMAFAGMTPPLAIAVGNAGGLGSFAVGLMPPPLLKMGIDGIRAGTKAPFNVNFITLYTEPAHIDLVAAERVAVASFHWGHPPRAWIDTLHKADVRVWEQVGSVDDAKRAVDGGVDAVIAQGVEAGGHNYGTLPTFALVPAVVDVVAPAMVLASGGIADGRGLAAALVLGADAAWVGTRLVATVESNAHDEYKRRLVAAEGKDTVLTSIFGPHHPEFNPMRVIRNRVVADYQDRLDEVPRNTENEPVIGQMDLLGQPMTLRKFSNLVPMPGTTGDFEEMPLLSGQGVGLVRSIEPAGAVVEKMAAEAAAIMARLAA